MTIVAIDVPAGWLKANSTIPVSIVKMPSQNVFDLSFALISIFSSYELDLSYSMQANTTTMPTATTIQGIICLKTSLCPSLASFQGSAPTGLFVVR